MSITLANITDYITAAKLWVGFTLPNDLTGVTISAAGVPLGARARDLGAVQGEIQGQYTPTIATVDIEQSFSPIAPHVTMDAMSIQATLVEPSLDNLDLISSQGTRWNFLPNSSFEGVFVSGLAPSWSSVGVITGPAANIATPEPSYGKSAQQFTTGAALGGVSTGKFFHPDLVAGKILVLSTYVKVGAATPNLTLWIQAYDSAGSAIGAPQASAQATSTLWTRLSTSYTLPALTETVEVRLQDATGQTATWHLDNAQLEIVASGSTPTTAIGPAMLSVGQRLDVRTFPVAIIGPLASNPAKYAAFVMWSAYVSGGLTIRKQRGKETAFQCTFTGIPVPTFGAGNQYGCYQVMA